MNILPHKSWHVRTKKNIARVREDERKAADEENEVKRRAGLAEQEARINLLRERSKVKSSTSQSNELYTAGEHVNFFKEVEDGKYMAPAENAERAEEKKQEKEKYEKQIGYLTYLGQDTNEILRKRDWYDMLPDRTGQKNEDGTSVEVDLKSKMLNDPLTRIQKYLGTSSTSASTSSCKIETKEPPKFSKYESLLSESIRNYRLKTKKGKRSTSSSSKESMLKRHKKKSKKKKSKKKRKRYSSTDSSDEDLKKLRQQKLEALRAERLSREKVEREKAENLLRKLRGETEPKQQSSELKPPPYKQKYNSQFNPEIARQNLD